MAYFKAYHARDVFKLLVMKRHFKHPNQTSYKKAATFLYQSIWKNNLQVRNLFIKSIILSIAIVTVEVISPLILKNIVAHLEKIESSYHRRFVILLTIIYGGSWLGYRLLSPFKEIMSYTMSQLIMRDMNKSYLSDLHSLPASFLTEKSSGYLLGMMNKANSAVNTLITGLLLSILPTLAAFITVVGMIVCKVGPMSGLIFLLSTAILILSSNFGIKRAIKYRHISNFFDRKVPEKFVDSILNFEIVNLFNRKEREVADFTRLLDRKVSAEVGYMRNSEYLHIRQLIILGSAFFTLNLMIIHGIINKQYTISDFVFIESIFLQFMLPLSLLGEMLRDSYKSLVDLHDYLEIYHSSIVMPQLHKKAEASAKKISRGSLEFRNVSFSYDKKRNILVSLSFIVEAGGKITIIGHSGCGKSTLIKLLMRLYEPDQGEIFIDGLNIKNYSLDELRQQIGIVPQDTILFNDTIARNIACSDSDAKVSDIISAAQAAELHEYIMSLPDQYETKVGERGIKLSGGERQRIALARIFLKDPRIIILDEATVSLDPRARKQIDHFITSYGKDKTIITVTHQIDTISKDQQILHIGLKNNTLTRELQKLVVNQTSPDKRPFLQVFKFPSF